MTQNQLPAHLQQYEIRDITEAAVTNLGSAMPPHVTIGNGRFTLIDAANNEIPVPTFDPQIGVYLDACIVDVADVMSRIYYEGDFDAAADGKRPACFSDNGIGPSVGAASPQAPTCAACPRSEWTKVNANGKKVPWCTQKYKVALLIPGFPTLFMLATPPASHGPLREYLATCKGNGVNAANLITRMWFTSQGVLGFMPRPGGPAMAYIDETVAKLRQEAYAQKRTDALVGRNDTVVSATRIVLPAQQAVQQIAAPVQQIAAPVQQPAQWPQGPAGQVLAQSPFGQAPAPGAGQGQQFVPPVQQSAPQGAFQQPNGQGWPGNQQVQQPGPFSASTVASQPTASGWPVTNATPAATAASPSEGQPAGRRKRRTQAEIAAANGVIPGERPHGSSPGQQTAPFPHPGQQVGGAPQQLEFGIDQGQDASASPEVQSVLNSFFGGQT